MAQHDNCVKFPCEWRKSVGYCPETCNHFKHKDEVIVVRCKDCKHYDNIPLSNGDRCMCKKFLGLTIPKPDDFCSYGERKVKSNEKGTS